MNFIFISPQFPHTYWNFCDRLKKNGVNVLGIGDTPYDQLEDNLKSCLTEYYYLDTLEDYDKVFRAVAFFSFRYGKIDWIESNNEYWLEQDARLRTDFHITTGVQASEIGNFKSKAEMKKFYAAAKVPTARQHKVTTREEGRKFAEKVGYPVFAKPEIGVGATHTYKMENEEQLNAFYEEKPDAPYVMEEFVTGEICSYDAILDSHCDPLFESMTVWPPVAEIVEQQLDLSYYTTADTPEPLKKLGRATVKAFGCKSRFVHLEFFRLTKAKEGLGEVGDFVGLEVNMRPAGGYTPDMMNFAHSTDVYQLYADMVSEDRRKLPEDGIQYDCAYASRRDCYEYVHTHEEIMEKYGDRIVMCEEMAPMMWPQMGRYMYTARLDSREETFAFIQFVHEKK